MGAWKTGGRREGERIEGREKGKGGRRERGGGEVREQGEGPPFPPPLMLGVRYLNGV